MRAFALASTLLLALVALHVLSQASAKTCFELGLGGERTSFQGSVSSFLYITGTAGSRIVFARTSTGSVYRSLTGGSTFENLDSKLPEWATPSAFEKDAEGAGLSGVLSMYSDASQTKVYFFGADGKVWTTINGGDSFALTILRWGGADTIAHVGDVFSHPDTPNTVAIAYNTTCCFQKQSTCGSCSTGIGYTSDSFTSVNYIRNVAFDSFMLMPSDRNTVWLANSTYAMWYLEIPTENQASDLRDYIDLATSGSAASAAVLPRFVTVANVMEAPTVKTVGQQVRWMQYEGGQFYGGQLLPTRDFIFSLDLGKTFSVPLFSRPPGAPASVTIDIGYTYGFGDGLLFYVFNCKPYCTVSEIVYQQDLWVSDISNPGLFQWTAPQIPMSNHRNRASISLQNLGDIPGVYFSNSFSSRLWTDKRIYSHMSYNGGATWSSLPAPSNHTYDCQGPDCRLLLFGAGDKSVILSKKWFPNFIIANGVVGQHVDPTSVSNPNTFLTYDGGASWTQLKNIAGDVQDGFHLFEVAAGGSLVAFVSRDQKSNTLTFSIDGGKNFTSCTFGNLAAGEAFYSHELTGDPDGFTPNLILLAASENSASSRTVSFHFNFASLFPRLCNLTSDYMEITKLAPSGECILGEKKTYKVKKTDAGCFGAFDSGRELSSELCNCTMNDYGCHKCFYYDEATRTCEWSNVLCDSEDVPPPPTGCFTPKTYVVPVSGYRKLGNTKCIGDLVANFPTERVVTCPPIDITAVPEVSPLTLFLFVVIGLGTLVAVGIIIALYQRYQENKNATAGAFPVSPSTTSTNATQMTVLHSPTQKDDEDTEDVVL